MKKISRKEFLKIAAATGAAGLLASCGSASSSTAAASTSGASSAAGSKAAVDRTGKKTKVTEALDTFETLDPYLGTGAIMVNLCFLLFDVLWTVDEDGNTVGDMAKSWTVNGSDVDVELYDYITDSAGNNIKPSDVKFSYDSWKASGNQRMGKYYDTIEVTGDYTFTMKMTVDVYPGLLENMRCPIVSEAAYTAADADFQTKPVATGHYTCTNFIAGNSMTFEKRDSQWQSDKDETLVPYLYKAEADVVEIDTVTETQQIQTGLETGTLQGGKINATIAADLDGNADVAVTKTPGNYAHILMLNCYQGAFKDNLKLRQAVLYGIDLDSVAKAATYGTGHPAYTIGNEALNGYQTKWESEDYYNYDVDKAKQLMSDAGYPNGGLDMLWLGNTTEGQNLTAQVIQANLAELGITLKVDSLDNTTYMNDRNAYSTEEKWDLAFGDTVPKGRYVIAYQQMVDDTLYDQGNAVGMKDDNMQQIYMTALYDQTDENADALHKVVKDSASLYGLYVEYNYFGHDPNLEMVFSNDGEVAPNAFKLGDAYDVFA
jgi:ABC-type transport system substrate-binding protein